MPPFYEWCALYFDWEGETTDHCDENYGHRRLDALSELVFTVDHHVNDNDDFDHDAADGIIIQDGISFYQSKLYNFR